MTRVEKKSFSVNVTIERAENLPGRWEAHCLEVDVITYGTSPRDAFRMIEEAATMVIVDDLNQERDPLQRGAPEECWTKVTQLLQRAIKVPLDALDTEPGKGAVFVVSMRLNFSREVDDQRPLAEVIDLAQWKQRQETVLGLDRVAVG